MATKDDGLEAAPSSITAPARSKQSVSPWRTAEERAEAITAKKKRRRAAHRIGLRRSHANG